MPFLFIVLSFHFISFHSSPSISTSTHFHDGVSPLLNRKTLGLLGTDSMEIGKISLVLRSIICEKVPATIRGFVVSTGFYSRTSYDLYQWAQMFASSQFLVRATSITRRSRRANYRGRRALHQSEWYVGAKSSSGADEQDLWVIWCWIGIDEEGDSCFTHAIEPTEFVLSVAIETLHAINDNDSRSGRQSNQKLPTTGLPYSCLPSSPSRSLEALCRKRLWIIQELTLAKETLVQCGE